MILMVPKDRRPWPTLGPLVCDWIEDHLVFGPGDLRGQPARLDDEKRALIYRMYEVYPKTHANAGRRRFKRVGISLPKGLAKTEMAAWIAAAELSPDAPVRCTGWTRKGRGWEPVGGPVVDPYIPLVAYTEEQSDELCYGALKAILEESPIAGDFDIGLERIMRVGGDGKAASLSAAPNARDGARTTFAVADETHLWVNARIKQAMQTIRANLSKRKLADPWMLEITTAFEPGAGSVAEATMEQADAIAEGKVSDATLFFFHRQASDHHDLTTKDGARAAVIEASGEAASWRDIDAIVADWADPTTDRAWWERVWTNRIVQSARQAFNVETWDALAEPKVVEAGARITIGFDGSQFHDSTGIICTEIATGYQWVAGLWERPANVEQWSVPAEEVDAVVRALFQRYTVWRMYADPPYWQSWIALWIGLFGKEQVIEWWTNRLRPMAMAIEGFTTAMVDRSISHDGDPRLRRHLANARKQDIHQRDDKGKPLYVIRKERSDSPHKIDLGMAAILSWEARTDAVAAGMLTPAPTYDIFFIGGRR